jgi:hypothetical protein
MYPPVPASQMDLRFQLLTLKNSSRARLARVGRA